MGLVPGLTSKEKPELTAATKRIAELETELKAARRAVELLREEASPKGVLGGRGDGRREDPCPNGVPGAHGVGVGLLGIFTSELRRSDAQQVCDEAMPGRGPTIRHMPPSVPSETRPNLSGRRPPAFVLFVSKSRAARSLGGSQARRRGRLVRFG